MERPIYSGDMRVFFTGTAVKSTCSLFFQ